VAVASLAHTNGWHAFSLELVTAGIQLEAPMLSIAPIDLTRLRFRVPPPPRILTFADGSAWLEWDSGLGLSAVSPAGGSYLSEFLRLDAASDAQILQFAIAHGPLRDYGWQMLGNGQDDAEAEQQLSWRFTEQFAGGRLREPIEGWRSKAGQMGALLRAAAALQHGDRVCETDTRAMLYGGHRDPDRSMRIGPRLIDLDGNECDLSTEQGWRLIARIAAEWLPADDLLIRPAVDPNTASIQVAVQFAGARQALVGVLGLELAAALSSPHGIWSCDACSYPYTSTRTPRRDRRRFCPTCSESRAPARLWWREHRSKQQTGESDG
jgi:hypothetical protein